MPIQVSCPNCNRPLRVPDSLVGRKVKCTHCQTTFTASTGDEPAAPPPLPQEPPTLPQEESIRESESRPRPSSRRERPRDEYDDDRYGDDRYDEEPPRRSSRRSYERPHRAGMILTFGILGILGALGSCVGVFCCFFWVSQLVSLPCGILAWAMGGSDLREMREGRMDPMGEGTTKTGYYMGIVAVILTLVDIVLSIISAILGFAMQAAK
jgi:predicted Zn finger-like uncharacterized protein